MKYTDALAKNDAYLLREKFILCVVLLSAMIVLLSGFGHEQMWMEIDSYVLPLVSLEDRGSFIITQDDIDRAREEFPSYYSNVFDYDDLRMSKLIKVDEERWISFYFPIYAISVFPFKLLFDFFDINVERVFLFSNIFWALVSWYLVFFYEKRQRRFYRSLLLIMCPIFLYVQYIGAESLLFALVVISLLNWEKKRYGRTGFFISIASMANPTVMGIGIVSFLEWMIYAIADKKKAFSSKLADMVKICVCYIPSLIPFVFNKMILGKYTFWISDSNEPRTVFVGDSLVGRSMSYIFDINLGIACFAPVICVLILVSFLYCIKNRRLHILMLCVSLLFTSGLVSMMVHINSGMLFCARYVLWLFPISVFAVSKALEENGGGRTRRVVCDAACAVSIVLSLIIFEKSEMPSEDNYLPRFYVSWPAEVILDRIPEMYTPFCESIFTSRVLHVDGGYNIEKYAIYTDSNDGFVKKILYHNTRSNRDEILAIMKSDTDRDLSVLSGLLRNKDDGKNYYISINDFEKNQYTVAKQYTSGLFDWVILLYNESNRDVSAEEAMEIAIQMGDLNSQIYDDIYNLVNDEELSNYEYICALYRRILGRDPDYEAESWLLNQMQCGVSRREVFSAIIFSEEFTSKYDLLN